MPESDNLPIRPPVNEVIERESYRVTMSFDIEADPDGLPHALACVGRVRAAAREAMAR